ncbi:hypothetical protein KR222_001514 [Zaprionus bogoriensis]|nr:hypothetical protein KR222_001514 [Zaprionus bogoriensis]
MPEHSPAPTPHRAIYGFAIYMLITVLFLVYLAWAFLPVELELHSHLPDKYFAVFVPVLTLVAAFFALIIYPAINLSMTPDTDSLESVVDLRLALPKGAEFTSWSQLNCPQQDDIAAQRKASSTLLPIDCELCRLTHMPKARLPIPPLRFLDLQEINATYYN